MKNKFLALAKVSVLFGIIYALSFPYHAFAEERYICATVSKILETESEDCMYFIVKGNFVLEENEEKQLSICLDDGNDAAKDSALANKSFEQQKEIYILIDGSSVRKIQSKCR